MQTAAHHWAALASLEGCGATTYKRAVASARAGEEGNHQYHRWYRSSAKQELPLHSTEAAAAFQLVRRWVATPRYMQVDEAAVEWYKGDEQSPADATVRPQLRLAVAQVVGVDSGGQERPEQRVWRLEAEAEVGW